MRPRQYVTGTRHFSVEPSERTKGNEYKPELKKKITEKIFLLWNRLPQEAVDSPSFDIFKICL